MTSTAVDRLVSDLLAPTTTATTRAPITPLSVEREVELIENAQLGDERAFEQLLDAYSPTIRRLVRDFSRFADREEVEAEALAAFTALLMRHDPHDPAYRDGRLASRLTPKLREELWKHRAATSSAFHVPGRVLRRYYELMKTHDGDFRRAYDASISTRDIDPSTFAQVHAILAPRGSLTAPSGDGEVEVLDVGYVRLVTSAADEDADDFVAIENAVLCDVAFSAMSDEEARVIELAYGFTEYEPLSDAEVGDRIGVTRRVAQRIRYAALEGARTTLVETVPDDEYDAA